MFSQRIERRTIAHVSHAEHLRDSGSDECRIADGCKLDHERPILEVVRELGCYLDTQPGLSRAPRAGERHEADAIPEQAADLGHLALAPEQLGWMNREIAGPSVRRGQGREVGREIGGRDLGHTLREREVLELVRAEVQEPGSARHGDANQGRRGL